MWSLVLYGCESCTVGPAVELTGKYKVNHEENSGIYKITRNNCNMNGIGQTRRTIFKEHIADFKQV